MAKHSGSAWERSKDDQMISIAVTQSNSIGRESSQSQKWSKGRWHVRMCLKNIGDGQRKNSDSLLGVL